MKLLTELELHFLSILEQIGMEIDFLNGSLIDVLELVKYSFYHSTFNTVLLFILIAVTLWRWK